MKCLIILASVILMLITCSAVPGAETTPLVTELAPIEDVFSVHRLLFVVGTNDGGAERIRLRYAGTDARSICQVFEDLGGVEPRDRILLYDPDRETFRNTLRAFTQLVMAAKPHAGRVEVFFYYSGHSNENGLLLNGELVEYKELRQTIDSMDADVRIIILDSCSSGALTRLKGGKRRAPFLLDTSAQMSGHAFLTSSSANEAAQESDRIGASFFTHALVSGLRGAADASNDGRVTLNEAYEFAFHSTLARTEKTSSGPQHPGYNIQLVGAGDLVMTDLRGTSAGLVLAEDLTGRLHVRDADGTLVVEVEKPAGRNIELGLEPGDYRVILDQEGQFYGAKLTLTDGKRMELALTSLNQIATELTAARGDQLPAARPVVSPLDDPSAVYKEFSFSIIPGMGTNGRADENTISKFSLNLSLGRNRGLDGGLEVGGIGNWSLGDVKGCQIAGGINLVEGNAEAVQISGLLNRVWGDGPGVQISGLVNSVAGEFNGVQLAVLANIVEGSGGKAMISGFGNYIAGDLKGTQLAGTINVGRGDIVGAQLAGSVNVAMKRLSGAQLAGAFNYTERFVGLQLSGGMNLCNDFADGAQIGGACNYARDLHGLQLAVINITGKADGHQVGVVNVARHVTGTQVGLVNIANQVDGAPIGIINLIRRGRHNVNVWHSDTAEGNFGIKLGNENFYSIFAYGSEYLGNDTRDREFYGLGLGAHFNHGRLFSEIDLICYDIEDDSENFNNDNDDDDCNDCDVHLLNKLRMGFGWQLTDRLAIIAGGCVNNYVSNRNDGSDFTHGTWQSEKSGDTWIKTWPGVYAGVQLF